MGENNVWLDPKLELPRELDANSDTGWSEGVRPSEDVLIQLKDGRMETAWYSYTANTWTTWNEILLFSPSDVVAWMPLPAPYNESSKINLSPSFIFFKEAAKLQEDYKVLVEGKTLTKKALCDLCVPFRDKHFLSDSETLSIARQEMDLSDMVLCLQRRTAREPV